MELEIGFGKVIRLGILTVIVFSFAIFGVIYGYIANLQDHIPQSELLIFYLAFIFLGFWVLAGIWLTLYAKRMLLAADKITLITYKDTFELFWHEIKFVQSGAGNMIIGNETKHIALPDVEYWTGKQVKDAVDFLNKKILENEVSVGCSFKAILPFSKGFKV